MNDETPQFPHMPMKQLQAQALIERVRLFQICEIPQLNITDLRVTDPFRNDDQGRYHPIDATYFSAGTPCLGEAKCRRYKSTDLPDWVIESDKLNAMMRWRKKNMPKAQVHLVNVFRDGVVAIWNLDYARPVRTEVTENKWYNLDKDGKRCDKRKRVSYFSLKDALVVRLPEK